ncbi:MAG: hypothetical protein ACPL07_04325 [Candidatus Bathyarchaeia archaeon]
MQDEQTVRLCIELSREIYELLQHVAQEMNTTPEKLVTTIVEEYLVSYSPKEEKEVMERLKRLGYL